MPLTVPAASRTTARVVTRDALPPEWRDAYSHAAKERRYYELVEDTLPGQFVHRYIVVEEPGSRTAVQPCFFVDQDLVAASGKVIRGIVASLRRFVPRLLRLRLLMVGCAAGEGHIDAHGTVDQQRIASAASAVLPALAREHSAKLIVWKDFPRAYRAGLNVLRESGEYVRLSSMPATELAVDCTNFEEFLQRHVGRVSRKSIRRKLKAAEAAGAARLQMSVHRDISEHAAELHALYRQVHARSALQFETLTPAFLAELGRRMPDRARFFIWRMDGRAVAFSVCLEDRTTLYDEYLGLDYSVALDLHLYFLTLRDVLEWAAANGIRHYRSTPLNYDPKLHLGFHLAPLDLYVRATAPWMQPLMRLGLRWIEPTRAEPLLRRFPNAADLD
jgi:hypothetical protein